ncbi:MAG: response regulator transcription factor [Chitinophagales bacterium]|nr:response regulator transcription factor [Chitinophagales bacterium]MDW8428447.1 response regulator transcription factor [Chitinophagales bacterium]
MNKPQILLVEDDETLARLIRDYLLLSAFEVTLCADGESALKTFHEKNFDLCIVDVMLPKLDGFSLVQQIRQANTQVPVIFLTARSDKHDRIKGFLTGADDYITKPFDVEELVLRIRVILRRMQNNDAHGLIAFGRSSYNPNTCELEVNGQTIRLTGKEAGIMELLCRNKNSLVRRSELLRRVWGRDEPLLSRSMDVYLSKLRKYLAADKSVEIENHHGIGYVLKEK